MRGLTFLELTLLPRTMKKPQRRGEPASPPVEASCRRACSSDAWLNDLLHLLRPGRLSRRKGRRRRPLFISQMKRAQRPGPGGPDLNCYGPPAKLNVKGGEPAGDGERREELQSEVPATGGPSACRKRRRRGASRPCRAAPTSDGGTPRHARRAPEGTRGRWSHAVIRPPATGRGSIGPPTPPLGRSEEPGRR